MNDLRTALKRKFHSLQPFFDKLRRQTSTPPLLFSSPPTPAALRKLAQIREIFQPDAADIKRLSQTTIVDDPANRSKIIIDQLPYSWYPAVSGGQDTRIIHPGPIGRLLLELSHREPEVRAYLNAIEQFGVRLPNQGLAFYYPKSIKISRLLGPDYVYSGMTAADVLAGYTAVLRNIPDAKAWCHAKEAFLALSYPWDSGGVNFANHAILELPLFHSPPEIVLNGWLHALLFLHDYVETTMDEEADAFLRQNIAFLAKTLAQYDDEGTGLSRYSDSSPYRISIAFQRNQPLELFAYYQSKHAELENIVVPLSRLDNPEGEASPYDNQLLDIDVRRGVASAMITASQKYDTYLLSTNGPISITLDPGRHDWLATTPKASGRRIKLASQFIPGSEIHAVMLSTPQLDLIKGCHTSFTKTGRQNYYHVQHAVALLYLSKSGPWKPAERQAMEHYSLKWLEYMKTTLIPPGLSFSPLEDVLAALHRGKAIKRFASIEEILPARG